MSTIFLRRRKDVIPFKFRGFSVGWNPRRVYACDSVIQSFRNKLTIWKGKHLSLGGRVTIVNFVLCNLSIYSLSFFKVPVKV